MTNWIIHPEAPTDEEGHPIHPERGHRICAATKSEKTTPTEHGRERDDIPYCTLAAGWGVEGSSTGKCDHHGGSTPTKEENENVGADEGNTNAVTHGAYVEEQKFYQEVLSEPRRAIVDVIFEEYLEEAEALHGELPLGDEIELFEIAVMHGKHLNLEDWLVDRPDGVDSGHAQVDRERRETKFGARITYSESVVAQLQLKLSRERRAKLKHYGLDKSAESGAYDSMGDMLVAWKESAGGDE